MENQRVAYVTGTDLHGGVSLTIPAESRRKRLTIQVGIADFDDFNVYLDNFDDQSFFAALNAPYVNQLVIDADVHGDLVQRRFIVRLIGGAGRHNRVGVTQVF